MEPQLLYHPLHGRRIWRLSVAYLDPFLVDEVLEKSMPDHQEWLK